MKRRIPVDGSPLPTLRVQEPDTMPASGMSLDADVVVIGSGAGGAVAAYELSRSGAKVVVLEAGSYVPSSQFTERVSQTMLTMFEEGGNQANATGDLVTLQGKCIGGSTVVNAAICFRTPDAVLESWGSKYGLDNLAPEVLAPYFDRVERNLHIHTNGPEEINRNGRLLSEGATKLGIPTAPLPRNVKDCALTGHCVAGCKVDRKQSMLVSYLPWASELGATILSGTRALSLEVTGRRVTQVNAVAIDGQGAQRPVSVRAGLVVAAAGAIQTPLLFQDNALGNSSGMVGYNYACHPSTFMLGEHEDIVDSWTGATVTTYAGNIEDPNATGSFLLEAGVGGPLAIATASDGGVGKQFTGFLERTRHMMACVTLIHDHNVGRVYRDDGRKRIDYDLDDRDFASMKEAFRNAAKIYFAAGCERVYLPVARRTVIEREADVDSTIDALRNEKHQYKMYSYHPQGTMRMGRDPNESVVDPHGKMHDLDNVYVVDASLFPTSLLVNPQESVYAMSSYIADGIVARG